MLISRNVHEDCVRQVTAPSMIGHDTAIFLKYQMAVIRDENRLSPSWPSAQKLKLGVQNSSGLFLCDATICRSTDDFRWLPVERLDTILQQNDDGKSSEERLDKMYCQISRLWIASKFGKTQGQSSFDPVPRYIKFPRAHSVLYEYEYDVLL